MLLLTIDTGTTNTRVRLWRDGQVIGAASAAVGVRNTAISGSRVVLQVALRDTIASALQEAGVQPGQVDLAVAAGMITSSLGLHEMPHLTAPAGLVELACGMAAQDLPEAFSQPIWFIPGVRNCLAAITLENCEAMDMMRGEEVEVIGLLARLSGAERALLSAGAVFVLPGSHTKLIRVDLAGRIAGCVTTLAGELLQTLTQNTILAQSLDSDFAQTFDPEMVSAGAASTNCTGLGRSCFSLRILDQFKLAERNARANFLLGAVLASDILTLKNSTALQLQTATPLVIAGGGVMQQALALLIAQEPYFSGPVTLINAAQQANLSGFGAAHIAAARGLLPASFFLETPTP